MRILLFLFPIFHFSFLFAQEQAQPWNLQQCIEWALQHNIQVKQNILNEKSSEESLLQSRAQLLPSLNGNASNSYNSGKKIDPFTNQFTSSGFTLSQNFSLSTSMTLFSGFSNLNTIKQNQYTTLASQYDVQKMQNDISLQVASAYLQILLAQELLSVAQNQQDITKLQVERTQKLVDVGNLPKGNLFDIQAQFASEGVNVVNAENSLALASLNLVQMLNLDTIKNFSIAKPEITLPADVILNTTPAQVYEAASSKMPEIKSAEFKLRSSEKSIAVARAGMFPKLSVSASYGTGYSGASKEIKSVVPDGYDTTGFTTGGQYVLAPKFSYDYQPIPYSTQYKNNVNKSVGFYLSVPLFNNMQTHTAVQRAKISMQSAQLTLQLQKDNLRKTIQQSYNDAMSAMKKFSATQKAVSAMEESFKYMEQRFTVGAATSTEYNDSKNKLIKAKSDLLQSKYDAVFKMKVLDFYQGKPITL